MLQDIHASWPKITAVVLFLVAAAFLFFGAILGFNGLRPKPRWGYGAQFLRIMAAGGTEARKACIDAATNFQRDNLLRSNEAYAAIASIKNGVIFFALAVIASLLASKDGKPAKNENSHKASSSITNIEITNSVDQRQSNTSCSHSICHRKARQATPNPQ